MSAGWDLGLNLQTKFDASNYTHYEDMQNVQTGVVRGT